MWRTSSQHPHHRHHHRLSSQRAVARPAAHGRPNSFPTPAPLLSGASAAVLSRDQGKRPPRGGGNEQVPTAAAGLSCVQVRRRPAHVRTTYTRVQPRRAPTPASSLYRPTRESPHGTPTVHACLFLPPASDPPSALQQPPCAGCWSCRAALCCAPPTTRPRTHTHTHARLDSETKARRLLPVHASC